MRRRDAKIGILRSELSNGGQRFGYHPAVMSCYWNQKTAKVFDQQWLKQ